MTSQPQSILPPLRSTEFVYFLQKCLIYQVPYLDIIISPFQGLLYWEKTGSSFDENTIGFYILPVSQEKPSPRSEHGFLVVFLQLGLIINRPNVRLLRCFL